MCQLPRVNTELCCVQMSTITSIPEGKVRTSLPRVVYSSLPYPCGRQAAFSDRKTKTDSSVLFSST